MLKERKKDADVGRYSPPTPRHLPPAPRQRNGHILMHCNKTEPTDDQDGRRTSTAVTDSSPAVGDGDTDRRRKRASASSAPPADRADRRNQRRRAECKARTLEPETYRLVERARASTSSPKPTMLDVVAGGPARRKLESFAPGANTPPVRPVGQTPSMPLPLSLTLP